MFEDLQKPRKTHEKKTKWGEHDKFSKSAKKAGKRSHDNDDDWQDEIRNYTRNSDEQVA